MLQWLKRIWGETEKAPLYRRRYIDSSWAFQRWVRALGFEQTAIGQLLWRMDQRFYIRRTLAITLFSVLLSSLIYTRVEVGSMPHLGAVAGVPIKSPMTVEVDDDSATESKRQEAENEILAVFDFDADAYDRLIEGVGRSFALMRRKAREVEWPQEAAKRAEMIKDFSVHRFEFEKSLGRTVTIRSFEWLVEQKFSVPIENLIIETLASLSRWRILEGSSLPEASSTILLRTFRGGRAAKEAPISASRIRDFGSLFDKEIAEVQGLEDFTPEDTTIFHGLLESLVVANLTFNLQETASRRRAARETIPPVQLHIDKGQVILAEGQVVQPHHLSVIKRIRELKSSRRSEAMTMASAALFVVTAVVLLSFLRRSSRSRLKVANKDLAAMALVSVMVVLVMKAFLALADQEILSRWGGFSIPISAPIYLAPVALGPMLIGLLVGVGQIVWLYTMFLSLVVAVMVDFNYGIMVVSLIGGLAAGRGILGCQNRNQIYLAGLRVGGVQAITIFFLTILQKRSDPELSQLLTWNLSAALASGVFAAILAGGVVPVLESLFNYTTDIKLLELASLNHPLMKEMIVSAPGTYHHSLVVGSMCEAAAEKVGANPLLAKVMAYYHDIGKSAHAQYFIENQRPGQNPHDHISPHMSKTVLIAHVKDGAELGLRHRLGKPIIDGILQHHGTTLISYFYNRAIEEAVEGAQVSEDDFRYPGPKPQFREAAIVMLADSIEAAARSLDEPTSMRLQNIVRNVIQSKFLDGQLEDCNLTLRDLTVIEHSFKKILLGVYHQRIDYPTKYSATQTARASEARTKKGSHSA